MALPPCRFFVRKSRLQKVIGRMLTLHMFGEPTIVKNLVDIGAVVNETMQSFIASQEFVTVCFKELRNFF